EIEAGREHDGSGCAVTKAKITSGGKKVGEAQLKLRTMPFSEVPRGDIVKKRAGEIGFLEAIAAQGGIG
ncbi:beta-hydroxyacyl-ACP dehydratase, partial [Rhizobium ruizarguesonis]